MKEYIEKGMAIKKVGAVSWAASRISNIPAADVEEVRHGRWVNIVHAIVDTTGYCDKCHSQSVWRTRDMAYEICPHCGAKMDGGADK